MLNVLLLAIPVLASAGQTSDMLEFATLAAGGEHTCGITKSKAAYCWGSNQYGQIGDGKRTGQQDPNRYPTSVLGDHQFASLALGSRFTCGLTLEGKAYCWGYNFDGQIGDGTRTGEKFAPTAVKTDQVFDSIVAGGNHACALTGDGVAYCWGNSSSGQVGDGRPWNRANFAAVPTEVVGGHTFNQLIGRCGLDGSGEVYCWGRYTLKEYSDFYQRPTLVLEGMKFDNIAAGRCGLIQEVAWCWGDNRHGQLGDSTWTRREAPTAVVGGLKFFQLTAGPTHTCGVTTAGKAYCWGQDDFGQLGSGDRVYRNKGMQPYPVEVYGGLRFTQIVAGGGHTCALEVRGRAYCWGDNGQSQVGQDRTRYNYRNWPQLILGEPGIVP